MGWRRSVRTAEETKNQPDGLLRFLPLPANLSWRGFPLVRCPLSGHMNLVL